MRPRRQSVRHAFTPGSGRGSTMLTFYGGKRRFWDGISRRDFLSVGGLAVGGLTLADLLRLEAQGATTGRKGGQGDHHDLPARWPHASRYLRSQATSGARIPWRIQPRPDECRGRADLRTDATASHDHGQVVHCARRQVRYRAQFPRADDGGPIQGRSAGVWLVISYLAGRRTGPACLREPAR